MCIRDRSLTGSAVAPAVTTCWAGASSSSASEYVKPVSSASSSTGATTSASASSSGASTTSTTTSSVESSSTTTSSTTVSTTSTSSSSSGLTSSGSTSSASSSSSITGVGVATALAALAALAAVLALGCFALVPVVVVLRDASTCSGTGPSAGASVTGTSPASCDASLVRERVPRPPDPFAAGSAATCSVVATDRRAAAAAIRSGVSLVASTVPSACPGCTTASGAGCWICLLYTSDAAERSYACR